MGAPKKGADALNVLVNLRLTEAERAALDRQRNMAGFGDRSSYLRALIERDGKRMGEATPSWPVRCRECGAIFSTSDPTKRGSTIGHDEHPHREVI